MKLRLPCCLLVSALALVPVALAQTTAPGTRPEGGATRAPAWPPGKPSAPAVLPGKGLARFDFLYAGEAKTQDLYLVRNGAVDWEYHAPAGTRGEISDAVRLSNGNILFAHQFGITLLSPQKKVLWHLDAPDKTEIHTAVPIGTDLVLYVQNGNPASVVVTRISTQQQVASFEIPVKNPNSVHGHFRHARLTPQGTLLVAHMDLGKIVEYDDKGISRWSYEAPGLWSAVRLANGHTLLCAGRSVREITPDKSSVWEFTPDDIPDYRVAQFQVATRLPNGNTLVNNWVNQWNGAIDPATAPVQVWEITPDKQVAWALRSWTAPNLGPATILQPLDLPEAPEDAHFGDLR